MAEGTESRNDGDDGDFGPSTSGFFVKVLKLLRYDGVREVPTSVSPIDVKETAEMRFSETPLQTMKGPAVLSPGLSIELILN